MWGAIWAAIQWLLGRLLGKPAGPSQEAQAASQAAAATAQLQTENATDAQVQKAANAQDDVARGTDSDDKLRQYEAHDPNNRDG